MKKIITVLVLGVLMAGTTFAQQMPQKKQRTEQRGQRREKNEKSPAEMAAHRTEALTKRLNLNDSQQQRLLALNLKFAQQKQDFQANRDQASDREKVRHERQAIKARYDAELKGILDQKQYAQYEAHREEMKAKHQQHRKGQRGERQQKS